VLIEDSFEVAAPRERVWGAIRDPQAIGRCIPGCESVETVSPSTYRAVVKIELGPIRARFNLEVEVTSERPLEEILSVTRGEEGTRASQVSATNTLRLAALEGGRTEVSYASEVSVVGRLGKFGLGVMRRKAQSLGKDFAQAFRARVESGSA
jgi:uncharacterized protein